MDYFKRVLILPVGSYEYHGRELPPETDTVIATGVADGLAPVLRSRLKGEVSVLPAVNYGFSVEHTGQPTTASIDQMTFYSYLKQLLFTVSNPGDFFVVFNGHGGNTHTIGALESDFNSSFADRKMFLPALYSRPVKERCIGLFGEMDVHAGSVEASLVAYYLDRPAREYRVRLGKRVRGSLRFFTSREIAPEGVIAENPLIVADPQKGQTVHEAILRETTESVLAALESLGSVIMSRGNT